MAAPTFWLLMELEAYIYLFIIIIIYLQTETTTTTAKQYIIKPQKWIWYCSNNFVKTLQLKLTVPKEFISQLLLLLLLLHTLDTLLLVLIYFKNNSKISSHTGNATAALVLMHQFSICIYVKELCPQCKLLVSESLLLLCYVDIPLY